jgi:NADPH2:quinone reductase
LVGTVGSPARVEAARQAGYDRVIARTTNMGELIRSAAGGAGVDVVLDPQGTALLEMDLAAVAPGGRIMSESPRVV